MKDKAIVQHSGAYFQPKFFQAHLTKPTKVLKNSKTIFQASYSFIFSQIESFCLGKGEHRTSTDRTITLKSLALPLEFIPLPKRIWRRKNSKTTSIAKRTTIFKRNHNNMQTHVALFNRIFHHEF
jgi:hypothetical protein